MGSIEELKAHIDIVEVASRYCEVQRINNNQYKAKYNPLREEKTSSLFFYRDTGRFKDFGSGEHGDILDLIQKCERCTLSEAKAKLGETSYAPLHVRPAPEVVVIDSEALEREFNAFEELTSKNPAHRLELQALAPAWLFKEADKTDLAYFKSITRYDPHYKTTVVGWYKDDGMVHKMVGYKRRRKGEGKWTNRMGTHVNSVPFSRIYHDNAKVFIFEGAHDAITAILLGLNFIAVPSASFKDTEALQSLLRDGDELRYLCEDMQGFKAMQSLAKEVKGELFSLSDSRDKKVDLSDFVLTCKTITEVKNALRC